MEVLKLIHDINGGEKYLQNLMFYVGDGRDTQLKGYGVNPYNPRDAFRQMKTVTDYYGKSGYNPLFHWVISYDKAVKDKATAAIMTGKIVSELAKDYQMITCVHPNENSQGFHAHVAMNSVNLNTGKLYHSDKINVNMVRKRVEDVTGNKCYFVFGG